MSKSNKRKREDLETDMKCLREENDAFKSENIDLKTRIAELEELLAAH